MAQQAFMNSVKAYDKATFDQLLSALDVDISANENAAAYYLVSALLGSEQNAENVWRAYDMLFELISNPRFDPSRGNNNLLFIVADMDLYLAESIMDHSNFDASKEATKVLALAQSLNYIPRPTPLIEPQVM
jgi:hypothetical protein